MTRLLWLLLLACMVVAPVGAAAAPCAWDPGSAGECCCGGGADEGPGLTRDCCCDDCGAAPLAPQEDKDGAPRSSGGAERVEAKAPLLVRVLPAMQPRGITRPHGPRGDEEVPRPPPPAARQALLCTWAI